MVGLGLLAGGIAHAEERTVLGPGGYVPPSTNQRTAGDKLGRGLLNIFTSAIEIPRNIHNTTQEESLLSGWTVGLGKGFGYAAMRALVGFYDVITFPFPLPADYAPVIEPEFVWQEPGPRLK